MIALLLRYRGEAAILFRDVTVGSVGGVWLMVSIHITRLRGCSVHTIYCVHGPRVSRPGFSPRVWYFEHSYMTCFTLISCGSYDHITEYFLFQSVGNSSIMLLILYGFWGREILLWACLSVCLSVRIYFRNYIENFAKFQCVQLLVTGWLTVARPVAL